MEFREIEPGDNLFEEMLPHLPPQVLEIGQKAWWVQTPGTLCEGVVRRIELGYCHNYEPEHACRHYVAQQTRRVRFGQFSSDPAIRWQDITQNIRDWQSGNSFTYDPTSMYPLYSTFDRGANAAADDMKRWAIDAKRSYEERLKWADALKTLKDT